MKKVDFIAQYGEEAYEKQLEQNRERNEKYREEHPEEAKAYTKKYNEAHPEQLKANSQEQDRKGGKRYDKHLKDNRTGLQGDKNKIRRKHAKQYKPYKDIIAPESQIHHEWVPQTDEYRGVALVEAEAHMHGFVDVIEILDGKITLLTEEQIHKGGV
jgi:hypothetical protein